MTLSLLAAIALSTPAAGAAPSTHGKFWGGIELGGGAIERSGAQTRTDTTFYLAFKGGFAISDRILIGAELSGHTVEAGDLWDSSAGEGLSQVFVLTQYYLHAARSGWYLKAGSGYVSYWDNAPGASDESGWGANLGVGYEWRREGIGAVGPLLTLGYGKADDLDHRSVALTLSWTFP